MSNTQEERIPISAEQAFSCLNITYGDRVHSFWQSAFLSGADLEFTRVREIIAGAESSQKLFLSDRLGNSLRHDVVAWDEKYQKWTYLECVAEKTRRLRQLLHDTAAPDKK